jgi:hypothetical protein
MNATRCIAWAAKKLSALLSSLLPATGRVRRTIKLIKNLLLPAPGRERSPRFAAGSAPRASRQPSRRRVPTEIANFPNYGTSPFRVSGFHDHSEASGPQCHGPIAYGGIKPGTCGSTRRKRKAVRPRWQAACGPSPNHGCAEPTRPEEPVHRRAHLSSIRNAILLRPPIELLAGAMCPRWARDEREVDLGVAVISFNRSEAAQGPRWDRELVPAMA